MFSFSTDFSVVCARVVVEAVGVVLAGEKNVECSEARW